MGQMLGKGGTMEGCYDGSPPPAPSLPPQSPNPRTLTRHVGSSQQCHPAELHVISHHRSAVITALRARVQVHPVRPHGLEGEGWMGGCRTAAARHWSVASAATAATTDQCRQGPTLGRRMLYVQHQRLQQHAHTGGHAHSVQSGAQVSRQHPQPRPRRLCRHLHRVRPAA